MYSEKKAALGLPQLVWGSLLTAKSWNVNGTPNFSAVGQLLKSVEPGLLTTFLHSLAYFSQLGYEPKSKYQLFYFKVYGNMAEENICTNSYRKFVGRTFVA